MNTADYLAITASRAPDATGLIYRDRRYTWRELDDEARAFAIALSSRGIVPGDRVAIWLPNHPRYVTAMYGAWRAGAAVVPINSTLTEPEAQHQLQDSGTKVLICSEPKYPASVDALRDALPKLDAVIVVGGDADGRDITFDALIDGVTGSLPAAPGGDALALIVYTSGTSGTPKGAMLTHRNLMSNVESVLSTPTAYREGDVGLCVLPLFHIFGLNAVLNHAVSAGATLVLLERFDARESLSAISTHSVNRMALAPPAYIAWLNLADATRDDFASIRVAVSGSAPLARETLDAFEERFGITIMEGYGLTEASPVVSSTAMSEKVKPGSIGRPIPGVEVELLAADGGIAEPGDPGEMIVSGPNVFAGYWGQPEASEAAMVDGWLKTGDVAVRDEDGDLFIVDRIRDIILVSGFNVYPKEVENVLIGHPKVAEVAVVGAPDALTGEQVRAFVLPIPGAEITEEELLAFAAASLAPYKVPAAFEVVAELPRNSIGKVLRRALR